MTFHTASETAKLAADAARDPGAKLLAQAIEEFSKAMDMAVRQQEQRHQTLDRAMHDLQHQVRALRR